MIGRSHAIQCAIENHLSVEPRRYPSRFDKLDWKLYVGKHRVVFKIVKNEVWIFAIMFTRLSIRAVPVL